MDLQANAVGRSQRPKHCPICLSPSVNMGPILGDGFKDVPFYGRDKVTWEREIGPVAGITKYLCMCTCGFKWRFNFYHYVVTFDGCETPDHQLSSAVCSHHVPPSAGAAPLSDTSVPVHVPSYQGHEINRQPAVESSFGGQFPPVQAPVAIAPAAGEGRGRGDGPGGAISSAGQLPEPLGLPWSPFPLKSQGTIPLSKQARDDMREIKACDMCRKKRKTCEVWHPGRRRGWSEWDSLQPPEKEAAANEAYRAAEAAASTLCDWCRVWKASCLNSHKGPRTPLKKWLRMSRRDKEAAADTALC